MEFVTDLTQPPEGFISLSLREYLAGDFPNGMPEESIVHPLRAALLAVDHLQAVFQRDPEVDAGRIRVLMEEAGVPWQYHLGYSAEGMQMVGAQTPAVGLWGVGIAALEMAYGSLPQNLSPFQLRTMGKNMVKILRHKVASGKDMIKKLPSSLEMLLDERYVNRRNRKLMAKRKSRGFMRALRHLEGYVTSLPMVNHHEKRSFSRNFLQVVLMCLDQKKNPIPIEQILQHMFFQEMYTNMNIAF